MMLMYFERAIKMSLAALIVLCFSLAACVRSAPDLSTPQTSTPYILSSVTYEKLSTATPSFRLLPTRRPGSPILTPTPDSAHDQPDLTHSPETYIIQPGDVLGEIAARFGVSLEAIINANGISSPDSLEVGQKLLIPIPTPQADGPGFKIIPDSELVYGPMSITLDVELFIQRQGGYLASYAQDVDGKILSGTQIILKAAQDYSVNPRLLLAILEYRSGWVTNPNPDAATWDNPIGWIDDWHIGLYRQLTWTANNLNRGYYLWRVNALSEWTLADGSVVSINPTINAGSAAVQNFFAGLDDIDAWLQDVSSEGLFSTFSTLFGYPFDLAIEPIVPYNLVQPLLHLPFSTGQVWYLTSGPHAGWDSGSAWAALDFAPPGDIEGCVESDAWVSSVADGLIIRSTDGAVLQDLDGDGFEQTGWVVFYMHISSRDRVPAGMYLRSGDKIGHPSCEGGISTGTHVHLARKFNGEWISADGLVPFNLDGWISSGIGVENDGYLSRAGTTVEAFDGSNPINQIQR